MQERRKASRRRMVLPVKVSVEQATHLAHTVDITAVGARIGGLRAHMQTGMNIELQRGPRRAKFQIKWINRLSENEIHIGVECVDLQEKFWGVDLADMKADAKKEMDALMTLLGSK